METLRITEAALFLMAYTSFLLRSALLARCQIQHLLWLNIWFYGSRRNPRNQSLWQLVLLFKDSMCLHAGSIIKSIGLLVWKKRKCSKTAVTSDLSQKKKKFKSGSVMAQMSGTANIFCWLQQKTLRGNKLVLNKIYCTQLMRQIKNDDSSFLISHCVH